MSREPPTPEQRATFLAVLVGMAKDYGYTQRMLLSDIAKVWDAVADNPPPLPPRKRTGRSAGGSL